MKHLIITLYLFSTIAVADSTIKTPYQPLSEDLESRTSTYMQEKTPDKGLTVEELKITNEYYDESLHQEDYDKLCSEDGICKGTKGFDNKISKTMEKIIPMAAKAYATFGISNSSNFNKLTSAKNKESITDYCIFLGMAGEGIATIYQKTQSQTDTAIANGTGQNTLTPTTLPQKESLLAGQNLYRVRKNAAVIQGSGWGSSGACYLASMTPPISAIKPDVKAVVKMAAAAGLTTFYSLYAKKLKENEEGVKEIISKFSNQLGDCNPITERQCYCSRPQNYNDTQYCRSEITQRTLQALQEQTVCYNSDLNLDKGCNCLSNDSCIDAGFAKTFNIADSGMNISSSDTLGKGSSIYDGYVSSASLEDLNSALNAINKNTKKIDPKVLDGITLTTKQKEEEKNWKDLGLSPLLAKAIASKELTAEEKIKADNFMKGNGIEKKSKKNSKSGSILTFSKPSSSEPIINRKSNSFDFNKLLKKKNSSVKKSGNVTYFQEKAMNNAGINNDSSRNIFNIISRRYQIKSNELKD